MPNTRTASAIVLGLFTFLCYSCGKNTRGQEPDVANKSTIAPAKFVIDQRPSETIVPGISGRSTFRDVHHFGTNVISICPEPSVSRPWLPDAFSHSYKFSFSANEGDFVPVCGAIYRMKNASQTVVVFERQDTDALPVGIQVQLQSYILCYQHYARLHMRNLYFTSITTKEPKGKILARVFVDSHVIVDGKDLKFEGKSQDVGVGDELKLNSQ